MENLSIVLSTGCVILFLVFLFLLFKQINDYRKSPKYLRKSEGGDFLDEPEYNKSSIPIDIINLSTGEEVNAMGNLYYSKQTWEDEETWYYCKPEKIENLKIGDIVILSGEYFPGEFGNFYLWKISNICKKGKNNFSLVTIKSEKPAAVMSIDRFKDLYMGKAFKLYKDPKDCYCIKDEK